MYSYGNKVGLDTHILHQDTRLACFSNFFCWFFDKAFVSALGPSIILENQFLETGAASSCKKKNLKKREKGAAKRPPAGRKCRAKLRREEKPVKMDAHHVPLRQSAAAKVRGQERQGVSVRL
jgi:hypothetical protein